MYSNCCCSCLFEPEILKIGQSSHKMYNNKILNFQESTTILNACTKKVWKLIEGTMYVAHSSVRLSNHIWEGGSNAQSVSAPTTTILPITLGTYHGMNCFSHMIYMPQTSTYQNIAKLLTHPSTSKYHCCVKFICCHLFNQLLHQLDIHSG